MFTVLTTLLSAPAQPEVSRPATEDIPYDWESGSSCRGTFCVVA
jgi:hypothetical protein